MRSVFGLFLAIFLALTTGLFWASFAYFKSQEIEEATARLTLHRSTLQSELRHFAHLPFFISLDPIVADTLTGGHTEALNRRLARFAQSAGIDAVFLMDRSGQAIAASNAKAPSSFIGQNYGFRPYFKAALRGELGQFYGIGTTTGVPGYFYAMAVRAPQKGIVGVIAIKVDLSNLQDSWQASGERILLTNRDGVVLLASDPEWRYRTLGHLKPEQRAQIAADQQFGAEPLTPLDWTIATDGQTVTIGDERLLYLSSGDLPNRWSLHFLAPYDRAVTRAWLLTGSFVLLFMLGLMGFQFRRTRRVATALRRSEHEETQLRAANERLAVEIDERRAAERNLQKTQADLERAGRLAALGQLASSVTHELGQPIAAMRNQLAATEMTSGATPLSGKMQSLVDRMESITTQLKFFSRKGRDKFEAVDLSSLMEEALDLLEPSILVSQTQVSFDRPDCKTILRCNPLRIEQVMTNIVRNALDATEDGSKPGRVTIRIGGTPQEVWFDVTDNGHGLGDQSLDDLREPFATTRESGRGMGLGLTISAGIVADHGGIITATNRETGGSIFRVTLPRDQRSDHT